MLALVEAQPRTQRICGNDELAAFLSSIDLHLFRRKEENVQLLGGDQLTYANETTPSCTLAQPASR